jgi:hypothetical protein
MRSTHLLFAALFTWSFGLAQNGPGLRAISAELGGVAQIFSLNYERVIVRKERHCIVGRYGIGVEQGGSLNIPHGITYNFGRRNKFLEAGLLGALGPTTFGYADATAVWYYIAPMVGYRSHPERGFLFKAYISPLIPIEQYPEVMFWGGIGFGYVFRGKKSGQ